MPCTCPIPIKNPNYGKAKSKYGFLKDCSSQYILVPCGHCDSCIACKQMSIIQRVQMMSLDYHIFFSTLTYNDDHLPRLTTSLGYEFKYADVKHLQDMFKRLRKSDAFTRPFKVAYASERGSERGRPHFHLLWFLPKYDGDSFLDCMNLERIVFDAVLNEWRVNVGSRRNPVYEPLCTYKRRFVYGRLSSTYDTHYIIENDKGVSDVAWYVTKYMLKQSGHYEDVRSALKLNYSHEEYLDTWSLVANRFDTSLGFGNPQSPKVSSYIRDCIDKSLATQNYPCYFSPSDGNSYPLCSYYRKKFLSMDDAVAFYYKNDRDGCSVDSFFYHEFDDPAKVASDFRKQSKRLNISDSTDSLNLLNY